jgi:hypothetical protein
MYKVGQRVIERIGSEVDTSFEQETEIVDAWFSFNDNKNYIHLTKTGNYYDEYGMRLKIKGKLEQHQCYRSIRRA